MQCDIITLFPDLVRPMLDQSILKRAQEGGFLDVRIWNLRDFTEDRHRIVDDAPYGGGAGMVLKAEPLLRAVAALREEYREASPGEGLRLLLPSPQGQVFSQTYAETLRQEPRRLVFLCGHYEGIDERVRIKLEAEEISIGDYVLTGGELPALVVVDAVARLIPGVLGHPESALHDSFSGPSLDHPHYTRPVDVAGLSVPDVLLSGNHEEIRRWRRREALKSTYRKRPDLLKDQVLTQEDQQLLEDIEQDGDQAPSMVEQGGGVVS